jgi:hypothetical protein
MEENIFKSAREMDADAQPPARLKAALMQKMAAQAPPLSLRQRVLRARIPAWQAAAAVLLAVATMRYGWPVQAAAPAPVAAPPATVVVRTDTVWSEKIQWRTRVVWHTRYRTIEIPAPTPAIAVADTLNAHAIPFADWTTPASVGTSLGDMPEALNFLIERK